MIEKLNIKIEEEINKVVKRKDLTVKELKDLVDIKNSLEMKDFFEKNAKDMSSFYSIDFEKGEIK